MFYISCAVALSTLFCINVQHLQAVNVQNVCHAQFPGVTEERANKLMGLGYEAVDAANKSNVTLLRGLLFKVKKEIEQMMRAQVKLDQFVDDAFWQAEQKGAYFSEAQKKQCKLNLGINPKGWVDGERELFNFDDVKCWKEEVLNVGAYQEYRDQPHYKPPVRLEAGLYLVIIGGLVAFIPFPGCAPAGAWTAGIGGAMMLEACVQGCERQEIDIRQRPIGF